MTDTYDPEALKARLETLDRPRAAAFAAMCAELLAPVWPRYCELTHLSEPTLLERTLDDLWAALDGSGTDLRARLAPLESDAPDEDDDPWVFESGYAQNASSSTVYAVQVWLDEDAQRAEWAARQVWEAADLTAEDEEGVATFGPPDEDDVVGAAVALLEQNLAAATDPDVPVGELRSRAQAAAERWWRPGADRVA